MPLAQLVTPYCTVCGVVSLRSLCPRCVARPWVTTTYQGELTVYALGRYHDEQCAPTRVAQLVQALKFVDSTAHAATLGSALAQRWTIHPLPKAKIVPVPLHPTRLVERGYNQSALIGSALARRLGVRVDHCLKRTKRTNQQARLAASLRATNTTDAFVCHEPALTGNEAGQSESAVYLLDDVATTGSTLLACKLALERRGYTVLGAICCALSSAEIPTISTDAVFKKRTNPLLDEMVSR